MSLNLKNPTILKKINNTDKQHKVEGIIEAQLKYIKRAQRVNLIVKYKAATAPVNTSTNARNTDFTVAINAVL